MSAQPTLCRHCHHWLRKEAPGWAKDMQMAPCALLRTKARVFAHWHTCERHQLAEPKDLAERTVWFKSSGALAPLPPAGAGS